MSASVARVQPLSLDEEQRFARLIAAEGWTKSDIQVMALRHVDQFGSRHPARIARWILGGGR